MIKKKPIKTSKDRLSNAIPLLSTLSIAGTTFVDNYTFSCGKTVPIYDVSTVHALNQLIGHAKFRNQEFGNVYYRGECKLHPTLKPSLFRKCRNAETPSARLMALINKVISDEPLAHELKLDSYDNRTKQHIIEGMLQHYGISTRYIDVVDNHWIALWMGLNQFHKIKQVNTYAHYTERIIPMVEVINTLKQKPDFSALREIASSLDNSNEVSFTSFTDTLCKTILNKGETTSSAKDLDQSLYQYMLLIAIPYSSRRNLTGIEESEHYIQIDLRQALPSTFLRPHAQHGLVVRKKVHPPENQNGTDAYDLAQSIIGIIRLRIDRVKDWIGTGDLLTQTNLFPPPAFDNGYDLLLSRSDIFEDTTFSVTKYI